MRYLKRHSLKLNERKTVSARSGRNRVFSTFLWLGKRTESLQFVVVQRLAS